MTTTPMAGGENALRIHHENLMLQLQGRLASAVADVQEQAEAYAKSLVPVASGRLQQSIGGELAVGDRVVEFALEATAPYAVHVENGNDRGAPAQPYMGPAARWVDAEGLRQIASAMRE